MRTRPEKYHRLQRLLHWMMAFILIGLVIIGLLMSDFPDSMRGDAYALHKSFGLTAGLLVLLRLISRFSFAAPLLPGRFKRYEKALAHANYLLLYLLMIYMPLSGYAMSSSGGHPVRWFGVLLPPLVEKDKALSGIFHAMHEYGGYVLIAAVLLHVAAAVKHCVVDRTNIFRRMW